MARGSKKKVKLSNTEEEPDDLKLVADKGKELSEIRESTKVEVKPTKTIWSRIIDLIRKLFK